MKNKARAARLRRKMRERAKRQACEARQLIEHGVGGKFETLMEIGCVEIMRFITSDHLKVVKRALKAK